jgi:hypothetical protein
MRIKKQIDPDPDSDTDPGEEITMIYTHVGRDLKQPAQSPMDLLMKK